jgi:1,4-dihydroxy-2-naphthoate octaprenyltransferase
MKIGQFVRLARVPTLAATAVPLMVGGALGLSNGKFDPLGWLDIFIVASLMQVATNALNEYGDYRHAVDTVPSPGFAGLIVSGEVSAGEVLLAAAACYAVAFLLGMTLVLVRGILMLLLGVTAILVGIFYSEGPVPISSTPFGEVLVGLVMGPIEVVSANLAASGEISNLALVFSIPVSLMVAAILLTNNLRDIDKDSEHGRLTLAILIGKKYGLAALFTLIMLTFLWSFPAFFLFSVSVSVFLLWLALPVALWSYSHLKSGSGWAGSVAVVARLHILVGALLTLSILFHF